jgi:hypothetical protein
MSVISGHEISLSVGYESMINALFSKHTKLLFIYSLENTKENNYFYYLNIFIHGSLSVACFSKGRGLKLLKRYKTKSKPKV